MQYPSTATGVGRVFTSSCSSEEIKEFYKMIALIVNWGTLIDPEESPLQIYYECMNAKLLEKEITIW